MDSSALYFSIFLFCVVLSWYLYRKFLAGGGTQARLTEAVNSGGKFVSLLLLALILPAVTFFVGHLASAVVFWLMVGLGLAVFPSLRIAASLFIGMILLACYSSVSSDTSFMSSVIPIASRIEPFVLVMIGSVFFQLGFSKMHELQVMRDIPRSKIRSVAVGAVEINGSIVARNVLTTPYSKSQCVYFKSELEVCVEHEDDDNQKTYDWEKIPGPSFKVPFWVKDETGEIMVDPEGAEAKISDREYGMLNEDGSPADADQAVSENYSPREGDRRYIEQFLAPNDPVFILGTAAIRKDGAVEQLVIQGGADGPFVISETREEHTLHEEKWEMIACISLGAIIFATGFLGILYLSNLL